MQQDYFNLGMFAGAISKGSDSKGFSKRLKRMIRRHGSRNFSPAELEILTQAAKLTEGNPEMLGRIISLGIYAERQAAYETRRAEPDALHKNLGIHVPGAKVPEGMFAKAPMPEPELPHSDPRSPFHKYWKEAQAGTGSDFNG